MSFKLPFTRSSSASGKDGKSSGNEARSLHIPWFSAQSFDRQLRILGFLLLAFLLLAAAFSFLDRQAASASSKQAAQAAKLQLYLQRLEKHAEVASISGDSDAFDALGEARTLFAAALNLLDKGGADLPATSGLAREPLDSVL